LSDGRRFYDVPPDNPFYQYIEYMVTHNIVGGYPDNTFRPGNPTTRGQLCKIVALAQGWQLANPPNPTFSDVPYGSTFYQYVETAARLGIVGGYPDGTFRPSNNVTRGQLCKIAVLADGWNIYTPPTPTFQDVPEDNLFYVFVETAYHHGIVSGYSDGTFRPGNNVTRGQLCKIIVLARQWTLYMPPTPTFRDVPPGSPFYSHVETAYNHNIISGYGCGTGCLEFRPGNSATRGQICKVMYEAISDVP
jgi:hypothetical protein